jgi:hypothetical protein
MRCFLRGFVYLGDRMAIAAKRRDKIRLPAARRSATDERDRKRPGSIRHGPV